MNNHNEHIAEIAQDAAKLYGQDWDAIPTGSRERWIEAVRHTRRGGGENGMDQIAGQAIDNWYKRQEARSAEPIVTPKPTKRGK